MNQLPHPLNLPMKLMPNGMNRLAFLLVYLLGLVPTYVLPYLSALGSTASFMSGGQVTFLPGLHIGALALCIYAAYARAAVTGQSLVIALAVIAAVFDRAPILSFIPFVPTVLHVIALVKGFSGPDAADDPEVLPLIARNWLLGSVALVVVVVAYALLGTEVSSPNRDKALGGLLAHGDKQAAKLASPGKSQANAVEANSAGMSQRNPEGAPVSASPLQPRFSAPVPSSPDDRAPGTVNLPSAPALPAPSQISQQLQAQLAEQQARTAEQQARLADAKAKEDAALAAIARLNEKLETRDVGVMAQKYVESYLAFIGAGDVYGAVAVFHGDRAEADRLLLWVRENRGIGRIEFEPVTLSRSYDKMKPNALRVAFKIFPGAPDRKWPQPGTVKLTLDATGMKFVLAN